MYPEQPDLPEKVRLRSLHVLRGQLLEASGLFDRTMDAPHHVIGADFIMIDERCGQVAQLMNDCCARIVVRMQELAGPADGPKWAMPDRRFGDAGAALAQAEIELDTSVATLDEFGQSVLEAAGLAIAHGDRSTADLLACLWRDVDRQLWLDVPRRTA
jgi:DNA-binding ferritin-like protein